MASKKVPTLDFSAEPLQVTAGIQLPGGALPLGRTPAVTIHGAERRLVRQKRIWLGVLAASVLLASCVFVLMSRPFWAGWPETHATITQTDDYYSKGDHCQVYLQYPMAGEMRNSSVSGSGLCAQFPVPGSEVTVVLNPGSNSVTRIIGHDNFLWGNIVAGTAAASMPAVISLIFSIAAVVFCRRTRKIAGSQPWQEALATVTKIATYRSTATLVLRVVDITGTYRTIKLVYNVNLFPRGARPSVGMDWVFWMVGDGSGRVVLGRPDSDRTSLGRITELDSSGRRVKSL